ncbi:MAG: hypothetical protein A2252_10560 [Elusimicrobia bacterium RIFOXYA2_FULL_39_19]|nr:MAG: hypothetical protein A2252_10560 [Elusimicrobia bacterium RIFOXYA2_FULL_39_19]
MPKKTKIFHIITRLDKGGSAENTIITCRQTNTEKFDSHLLFGPSNFKISELSGIKYFQIKNLEREISLFTDIKAFFEIARLLKTEHPDILHTHSSKAGFLGRWAAFYVNHISKFTRNHTTSNPVDFGTTGKSQISIKIVHTPHGHVFYGYSGLIKTKLFIILEKITALITDKLIALTEGERDESIAFGVGNIGQWAVVHSGVDYPVNLDFNTSELKKQLDIRPEAVVIGSVARLDPVKGIVHLVDAFKLLIDYSLPLPAYLLIVGDGTERKNIESTIQSLNLKNKVILTGMRNDVINLMSIMDIYVQPSLNEGMGKTILQAMLLKKAVIGTNVQGIPSLIKHNDTGILVKPASPQELAEEIEKLINDKTYAEKLGANAYAFVTEKKDGFLKFSPERMVFLLEQIYENL